jgi:competence protein ComEA
MIRVRHLIGAATIVACAASLAAAQEQPKPQATVTASAPASKKASSARKATAQSPVNINTATLEELQTLPGIGPSVSKRILDYRQKNGAFKKPEDLMNVRGIGEKSFLKLKPLVAISAAAGKTGGGL